MTIHNTLFVGKVLLHFTQLASTNDYAFDLLQQQKPIEGTVILTDHQYRGKGQMGNHWESKANENISVSIIFHPSFLSPKEQFYLNIAISLAVRNTLAHFTHQKVQIKWPNDILIQDQKVAGILIQNLISSTKMQSSVVGIGINVNQSTFSDSIKNATSLHLSTGQIFRIPDIVQQLCQQIEANYLLVKKGKYKLLRTTYFQHLFRFQKWADYELPQSGNTKGKIIDVLENGRLVVEHKDMKGLKTYQLKEIQFVL
ncbi:MAG: biotin--[acetyl-CoA-carboxylase] ligase [Bacteroidota bacterium]